MDKGCCVQHKTKVDGDKWSVKKWHLEKRSGKRKYCKQQVTGTAGGRWKWQRKTEMDGDKCAVEQQDK